MSESSWKNGVPDDEGKFFDKDGNLINVVIYKNCEGVQKF